MMVRFIVLAFLAFLLSATAIGSDMRSWQGQRARADAFEVVVIRTVGGWRALWLDIGQDAPIPWPENAMGVAVFLGGRTSGGYQAEILGIERRGCLAVVRFRERGPGSGEPVIKMLTAPWAAAIVPSASGPVVFEREGAEERPLAMPASEGARLAQVGEICGSLP